MMERTSSKGREKSKFSVGMTLLIVRVLFCHLSEDVEIVLEPVAQNSVRGG